MTDIRYIADATANAFRDFGHSNGSSFFMQSVLAALKTHDNGAHEYTHHARAEASIKEMAHLVIHAKGGLVCDEALDEAYRDFCAIVEKVRNAPHGVKTLPDAPTLLSAKGALLKEMKEKAGYFLPKPDTTIRDTEWSDNVRSPGQGTQIA